MKVTKGNRIIYDGTDKTLKHGSYNPKLKRYYNSSTGKWVSYPVKIIKSKFFMYEFECFDYDTCKSLFKEYNINVERVLKFIDRIYRTTKYIISNDRFSNQIINNHVRVYYREFENILGVNKINYNNTIMQNWEVVLSILTDNNIISYINDNKNLYDNNKELWYIQLNDMFYDSKKHLYKIKDSRLVLHLEKQNKKIKKTFDYYNKLEVEFTKSINLDISKDDLIKIAEDRYNFKKQNAIEMLDWDILSYKSENSVKEQLKRKWLYNKPINNRKYRYYKDEYIETFLSEYEDFKLSLNNLKNDVYLENRFSREKYGGRITNLITNLNRHLRSHLTSNNEQLITLDLRTSYISLFYTFCEKIINYDEYRDKGDMPFLDIYYMVDKYDIREFYYKHKDIRFRENYNDFDIDFYKYVSDSLSQEGIKLSRFFIKELVNRVINSNNIFMKDWKVGKYNINDIKRIIFTQSGVSFVDNFKEYDLSKYWGLNKRRDNYKPYKNLNILLVRFESLLMRSLMKTLKQNNIDFISVYDSFMVRELDIEKTFNILNRSVKNYGRCLTFKT
jgi:hypothetical protein